MSTKHQLTQAYTEAIRQFQRAASRLAQSALEPSDAEAALIRVEQARRAYNDTRDSLAAYLMSPAVRGAFLAIPQASGPVVRRVRSVAELLWELEGKPQGTADADWHRAERVLNKTGVLACCA